MQINKQRETRRERERERERMKQGKRKSKEKMSERGKQIDKCADGKRGYMDIWIEMGDEAIVKRTCKNSGKLEKQIKKE